MQRMAGCVSLVSAIFIDHFSTNKPQRLLLLLLLLSAFIKRTFADATNALQFTAGYFVDSPGESAHLETTDDTVYPNRLYRERHFTSCICICFVHGHKILLFSYISRES